MTIACGTDFSESSLSAARAACAIAKRLGLPLKLVHVSDAFGNSDSNESLRARLFAQAEALRGQFGIDVEPVVERGAADEGLVELASSLRARLLVVSSLGDRKQRGWQLGSVAERVAQAAPVPVLVVREGASIEAWARGERALRVMVGVDLTPNSKAALDWADDLREVGPCELHVVQIAWPAEEHDRIAPSPMPLDHLPPELEQALLRDLKHWSGEQASPGNRSYVVRSGWGRVDAHLTQFAAESAVDLLVVGTHQRAGIARFWQGSVSRGVLHGAAMSVACVPLRMAVDGRVETTP